jgi:hypothetical protein
MNSIIWADAPGIEPRDTYVPIVAKRREDDADLATKDDARRREVSALSSLGDPVEAALDRAAEAGRFDVVAQLARELEARRLARADNVVMLKAKGRPRGT